MKNNSTSKRNNYSRGLLFGILSFGFSGIGTFLLILALNGQEIWRPTPVVFSLVVTPMPALSIVFGFSVAKRWTALTIVLLTLIGTVTLAVVYCFVALWFGLPLPFNS